MGSEQSNMVHGSGAGRLAGPVGVAPGGGAVVQAPAAPNPAEVLAPIPQIAPIRDFRPRRHVYNRAQKERAVRLLNMGIPCRQVARMIGPRCSSGSPIRWRQQARRQAEARRRLDEMMRNRNDGAGGGLQ